MVTQRLQLRAKLCVDGHRGILGSLVSSFIYLRCPHQSLEKTLAAVSTFDVLDVNKARHKGRNHRNPIATSLSQHLERNSHNQNRSTLYITHSESCCISNMASADPQPALATTKRKFHKLLDNLTANTSTTSLASTLQESNASTSSLPLTGSPEPPNKRPRSSHLSEERERNISAGQERIRVLKEQLLTPRRKDTVRVVGKSVQTPAATTTSTTASPRKPPNFQPYSQEQFLERLKTFADVKRWTTKPDTISEVEWAKRGWSCDTWNTVACKGGCEKRVAVKLRPKRKDVSGKDIDMSEDLAVDIDDALMRRYQAIIIAGHSEDCLWRKKGCQGMLKCAFKIGRAHV